jgi:Zn-dependent M28 family amino/carboxypeptidase
MPINTQMFRSVPFTAPRIDRYNNDTMRGVVESLSFPRVFGTPANERAMGLICKEFAKIFGELPEQIGDTKNVIMGNADTAKIIVGAHYDSVAGTPGADDNASALAVMFRIAANIHAGDKVCFVAFNGEECGLLGSKEFVKGSYFDDLEQVHILEMVGYRNHEPDSQRNPLGSLVPDLPTVGDFIGAVANTQKLMDSVRNHANSIDVPVVGLSIPIGQGIGFREIENIAPHLLRSDHAPFWQKGHPTIMWTDTAEFRNPNYHQSTDTPDTLDYDFMAATGDLIVEMIKGSRQ